MHNFGADYLSMVNNTIEKKIKNKKPSLKRMLTKTKYIPIYQWQIAKHKTYGDKKMDRKFHNHNKYTR